VINLASQLTKGNKQEEFPDLVWVLRDFALQMVDHSNLEITSKQYLENSLQDILGNTEIID
jgi:hypothetical protein